MGVADGRTDGRMNREWDNEQTKVSFRHGGNLSECGGQSRRCSTRRNKLGIKRCGGKRKPSFQMGNVGRIHYGTVGTLRLAHISSQRSVLPEGLLQYYGMIESGPVRVSFQMDLSAAVGVS